ncbi:ribonuclease P/MRP protein subunit [Lipomyces oligophaga]|uniref:ribonuclease P/MRP protein subunit n=1 Tax=Lipomyces oligophaga TaxID=45792 RepID=UPI0034CD1C4E
MVRFKSRYILFTIHYPYADDVFEDEFDGASESTQQNSTQPSQAKQNRKMRFLRPAPAGVDASSVGSTVKDGINRKFGDLGSGLVRASVSVKYFSAATSTGIIRVTRDQFRILWYTLTMINEISGVPVVISVQHVSGTMRKCEKAVMSKEYDIQHSE